MRASLPSLILLAAGCVGAAKNADDSAPIDVPGDADTDTDSDTDGDTDADTDTDVTVPDCIAPLGFETVQTWEAADLFPSPSAEWGTYPGSKGPGVALTDLDGDGWLDAVLVTPYAPAAVLKNDGVGHLIPDTTATADGLPLPAGTSVAAADLDGDADPDLVFAGMAGQDDQVLINDGALQFRATVLPGSTGESKTAAFGDADGDGDLDLYIVGNTYAPNPRDMEAGTQDGDGNQLWIQGAGGVWTDETAARLPAQERDGLGYHGAWLDFDGDLDLDLYVTNDWGGYVVANQLLENDGTGHFVDVAHTWAVDKEISGMGVAVGDADGDARPDLFLTDLEHVWLFVNFGNTYVDFTDVRGVIHAAGDGASWGASFTDFDRDGLDDIATVYGVPEDRGGAKTARSPVDALWQASPGSSGYTYTDVSAATGFADDARSRSLAIGDLDRDGRVDAVRAGEWFFETVRGIGGCAPGITLQFAGPPENRDGIGAAVEIERVDGTGHAWMLPSTTYSSSAPELYLGLHGAAEAVAVRVTWPDGEVSTIEAPAAGTTVVATHP